MDQRYSMDLPARDPHAGRNHCDAIPGRRQSDQSLRSGAFKEDARSDAGDLASGIKPFARGKSAAQQQQGVIREFFYIEGCAAAQAVTGRQNRKDMDRVQQPRAEPFIAFRHDRKVHVAAFKSLRQANTAVLDEANLDARMAQTITSQKIYQEALDGLRRRTDSQQARVACLERARPLAHRISLGQETAPAQQQVFAF
jgi:hypothetical protein